MFALLIIVKVFEFDILMLFHVCCFFFFKQKTAYEMRISDWSSDVCSSDLGPADRRAHSDRRAPQVSGARASTKDHRPRTNGSLMRRVVVTGMGIVSSIGSNKAEVLDALRAGRSGIEFCDTYAEMGFRRHVHGSLKVDLDTHVDRKVRRFMGDGAAYKDRKSTRLNSSH